MSLLLSRSFLLFFPFVFVFAIFFLAPRKTTQIKKYAFGVIAPRLVFFFPPGKFGKIPVLSPGATRPFLENPEKSFVKLRPAYSVKRVFSYVLKGIKIKITVKHRASRRLHFEDKKRIMSPEMRPKSFGTFEKRAPGK